MGYDVYLKYPDGSPVKVPLHEEGGTFVAGGTDRAELSITNNYSRLFMMALGPSGIGELYGKQAREVIPILETAVRSLGTERDDDYWAKTRGNAGAALSVLLGWAQAHPDAYFTVH